MSLIHEFNLNDINLMVEQGNIEWSAHALRRMIQRGITRRVVKHVICEGEIIEVYNDDKPFPSILVVGYFEGKAIHVILAYDDSNEKIFLITVYYPDLIHFLEDYKTRRKE